MPQKRWPKPSNPKLATMNRFYVFGGSFLAHPHDILIKQNVKKTSDKGKIWGEFYIPEVEESGLAKGDYIILCHE